MPDTSILETTIGYTFKDKDLLKRALTHSSYASEHRLEYPHNNERLEFLGDAYLDAIVGSGMFEILKEAHEGTLSRYRADVVCESSLADTALSINLGDYLYMGRGEETSGGRYKSSILADALEALIGAVFLDGGFDACRELVLRLLGRKIEIASSGSMSRDFKTRLQEKIQSRDNSSEISYKTIDEQGPDHMKTFTVEVSVNDVAIGKGKGSSKARAEQAAAEDALAKGVI